MITRFVVMLAAIGSVHMYAHALLLPVLLFIVPAPFLRIKVLHHIALPELL